MARSLRTKKKGFQHRIRECLEETIEEEIGEYVDNGNFHDEVMEKISKKSKDCLNEVLENKKFETRVIESLEESIEENLNEIFEEDIFDEVRRMFSTKVTETIKRKLQTSGWFEEIVHKVEEHFDKLVTDKQYMDKITENIISSIEESIVDCEHNELQSLGNRVIELASKQLLEEME